MANPTSEPKRLPAPPQTIDPETQLYWDAAADGSLLLPRCEPCGSTFWYPRGFCPRCGGTRIEWIRSAGTGTVYSYTHVRRSSGAWAEHVPYCLAHVALDDGPTIAANIVGADVEHVEIGTPVRALFQTDAGGSPALRFTPAD